jgi:hypothetical protein
MAILKKDFKFKLIKQFLSQDEIEIGKHYLLYRHKQNTNDFDDKQNNNMDSRFYGDIFTETMLVKKVKKMQEETGLKLIPTYSFSRVYTYNAELTKHTDRPSCEVSVTTMWGSDGTPWPIFVNGEKCDMEPGDAVVYLGCELEHWRKPFEGDWHAQSFLHYIDANGPFKEHAYDKRDFTFSPEISYMKYKKNVE